MPRQSRERLTPDPDRGSYKLTLTSNEDCIPTTDFHENMHPVKIGNLPDVLPLGVKMKNLPARYGSNNNLLNNNMHHKSSMLPTSMESIPQTAPVLSAYSMKNMFNFNSSNNLKNQTSPTAVHHNHAGGQMMPNGGYPVNGDAMNQRFMSQSINDLKRAQHIFGSNDLHFSSNKLSQAESDASLADTTNRLRNEFVNRSKLAECSPIQPKINNCHQNNAVNNKVTASPVPTPNKDDKVIRTNSLKENIDKITQLQTKLMSPHSHDLLKDMTNKPMVGEVKASNEPQVAKEMNGGVAVTTKMSSSPVRDIAAVNGLNDSFSSIEDGASPNTTFSDDSSSVSSRLTTSEAASQTDDGSQGTLPPYCDSASNDSKTTFTALLLRTKYPEELDCEQLAESLVQQLAPTDRLHNILGELTATATFDICFYSTLFLISISSSCLPAAPKVYKITSDYVTGLYNPQMTPRNIKKDAGTSMHRESDPNVFEE